MTTTLAALYFGIGNYGSFISGLATINDQLSTARTYLANEVAESFHCPKSKATSRKRTGTVGSLHRLFIRVQSGQLTPDQAIAMAEALIGEEDAPNSEFLDALRSAFHDCPKFHEQLPLQLTDSLEQELLMADRRDRPPPRPLPRPDTGPPLQLRIEVWRESKHTRRHSRVIQL